MGRLFLCDSSSRWPREHTMIQMRFSFADAMRFSAVQKFHITPE